MKEFKEQHINVLEIFTIQFTKSFKNPSKKNNFKFPNTYGAAHNLISYTAQTEKLEVSLANKWCSVTWQNEQERRLLEYYHFLRLYTEKAAECRNHTA